MVKWSQMMVKVVKKISPTSLMKKPRKNKMKTRKRSKKLRKRKQLLKPK